MESERNPHNLEREASTDHPIYYQNRFINESFKKNCLKFSERRKDGKTEFFVRCRGTYVRTP